MAAMAALLAEGTGAGAHTEDMEGVMQGVDAEAGDAPEAEAEAKAYAPSSEHKGPKASART